MAGVADESHEGVAGGVDAGLDASELSAGGVGGGPGGRPVLSRAPRARLRRALLYSLFAVIALTLNLLTQIITLELYRGPYRLILAIVLGTLIGLPVKYFLDKHYIFRYEVRGLGARSRTLFKYTLFSGLTTLVFWGFEYAFEFLYRNQTLTLVGGAIGLIIGYAIKYRLDKHYVFSAGAHARRPERAGGRA